MADGHAEEDFSAVVERYRKQDIETLFGKIRRHWRLADFLGPRRLRIVEDEFVGNSHVPSRSLSSSTTPALESWHP